MAVRHSAAATSGANPVPATHIGLNYQTVTLGLTETASASTTLVMCRLPAGSVVRDAYLTINNDALDTTGGGGVVVQSWTNATAHATHVRTASGSAVYYPYAPTHASQGYRHTASSLAVITLHNFVGTGTATTAFRLTIGYEVKLDGD